MTTEAASLADLQQQFCTWIARTTPAGGNSHTEYHHVIQVLRERDARAE